MKRSTALTFFLLLSTTVCAPALGASFNCAKAATPLEKTICNSVRLDKADTKLGEVYGSLRKMLSAPEKERLKTEHVAWLKQRTMFCDARDVNCLLPVYEARVSVLSARLEDRAQRACYEAATNNMETKACASQGLDNADAELDRVYKEIMERIKDDPKAVETLKASQRKWLEFRIAEMAAIFPHHDEEPQAHYGSSFPMCWSLQLTRLTKDRVKQLRIWLDREEGDVCAP